jgi:hypothetical protein
MRYTLAVASVAVGLGIGIGVLIGWRTAEHPPVPEGIEKQAPTQPDTPLQKKDIPPKPVAEKPGVEIPLAEIYATSGQFGLKSFPTGYEEVEKDLKELTKRLETYAVPTAFHVSAFTAASALEKTLQVFSRGKETRFILRTLEPEWEKRSGVLPPLWAVLYLGTQAHTPYWSLTSVVQKDSEVVIKYKGKDGLIVSGDREDGIAPHCYWIPLKPVPPGNLTIRVFDETWNFDALLIRTRIIK